MYIAINKRKENIAEYILYLWQLEDLLRALQFSPEAVYSKLVEPRRIDPAQQQELLIWYMDLANLLREEGKEESEHLDHTLHLISDLQSLHLQLMQLPAGEHYRTLFGELLPELPRLRELISGSDRLGDDMSDIELCFRALYAVMLYRIQGSGRKSKITEDVTQTVSPVIAELARIYGQVERGETDIFEKK